MKHKREQRLQRLRVIPVVEVAPVPIQGFHCSQCILRALDELSGRKVAEVVRGQIRKQRKSHVGRRRAMRDHGSAILLIVIRRQPVVLRADECLKEGPGFSGKLSEKKELAGGQSCFSALSGRLIHHAMTGEANQSTRRGPAAPNAAGFESAR